MCTPLAGLIIRHRIVTDESGIVHSHEELFKRAFPLEESQERALLNGTVLAWECTPAGHWHADGSAWFELPTERWDVHIEEYSTNRMVVDSHLEDRIRAEARKWKKRFVVDVGDKHICGGVYYLLRCNGATLSGVTAERVIGHAKLIESSNIGVCNADVQTLRSSLVRRLYACVDTVESSLVCYSGYSSFGYVERSNVTAHSGNIKYGDTSIISGSPLIYQQKDCLTFTQS